MTFSRTLLKQLQSLRDYATSSNSCCKSSSRSLWPFLPRNGCVLALNHRELPAAARAAATGTPTATAAINYTAALPSTGASRRRKSLTLYNTTSLVQNRASESNGILCGNSRSFSSANSAHAPFFQTAQQISDAAPRTSDISKEYSRKSTLFSHISSARQQTQQPIRRGPQAAHSHACQQHQPDGWQLKQPPQSQQKTQQQEKQQRFLCGYVSSIHKQSMKQARQRQQLQLQQVLQWHHPGCVDSTQGSRTFHTYGAAYCSTDKDVSLFTPPRRATTILCVRKGDQVCVAGDGMVSQGQMIVKPNARKIRRLQDDVVCGFAGATADCFTLVEKLEAKLEEYPGQLLRACVELAKQWRTDRYLRHLEAVLIVADKKMSLEVSGVGDVLESHDGILGVGSGGPYAVAAARALYDVQGLTAHDICKRSMAIAASMCCHTNDQVVYELLPSDASSPVIAKTSAADLSEEVPDLKSTCSGRNV